jgi:Prefoldin subunit
MLNLALQPGSDPIEATFELNDTLYAKAHIPPTDEVYLWLGVSFSEEHR